MSGSLLRLCVLISILLCFAGSAGGASFIEVEEIEQVFADKSAYGQVVRKIRLEGNGYTRGSIIHRAMATKIGDTYTQVLAQKDLLSLLRLGSFTSVHFDAEPVADGITLVVTVAEATPYIPSLSFALTQENGIEIGPAVSSSNLFGYAARASVYARFGGATNIGLRYADPQLRGQYWDLGWRFEYFHRERRNEILDFKEGTDEIFVEFKRNMTDDFRLGPRFRYMTLRSDQEGITLAADNRDQVPSLGVFIEYDTRNGVYPTSGWYLDCEASKYGMFGTDTDFWRWDFDIRRYVPLSFLGDRHSLALYSYLTIADGTVGETLPLHQLFYIGGTNSVRGWSLDSRRGRRQWLGTAEYWFQLMQQRRWKIWFLKLRLGFSLGAFGDIGSAWNESGGFSRAAIGGGGVGFRITLPVVTVIRFDLAVGEEGPGVRIFIGGNEKAVAQKYRVR